MITHRTGTRSKRRQGQQARYDVLLIGSGMASLTAAALLAHSGRKVCILEADGVGGGYQDCGKNQASWGCALGDKVDSFLRKIGLRQEILFQSLDRDGYDQVVLPDRQRVKFACDYGALASNIERAYPGQGEGVRRLTAILERLAGEMAQLPEKLQWWQALTQGWKFTTLLRYHRSTLQQVLDECRVGAEAQAALSANSGNFMSPPDELSLLAYAATMSNYQRGAYVPEQSVSDRLLKFITSHPGCDIFYRSKVSQVCTSRDFVDAVVTEDGRRFNAPTIVCNGDPRRMADVIGREKFPASYLKPLHYDYSLTAVSCSLEVQGLDLRDYGFGRHNTWHLEQWDMNRTWDEALGGDWSRPWMFMATPSLHGGSQVLELATAANYDFFHGLKQLNVGDYHRKKSEVENRLIDLAEAHHIPNLRKHIRVRVGGSARRSLAYGQHLTPANLGLGRPKTRTPWANFFWCNAASGLPGIGESVSTGMGLYIELTGDRFWNPAQLLEAGPPVQPAPPFSLAPAWATLHG